MTTTPTGNADPLWEAIRKEAESTSRQEPVLATYLHKAILRHANIEGAMSGILAEVLASRDDSPLPLERVMRDVLAGQNAIADAMREDLQAVKERDPACLSYASVLLHSKGFQALQGHRVAHQLYREGRTALAFFLQGRIATTLAVDIHPAARIGQGVLIDHATGIVIGETAVVGNNVSLLHEVTLGGTGKTRGDRHPKVRDGVLIGAGAKLLGNIVIGEGAKVGAGSVVLKDVPPHHTVAGVPAKVVGCTASEMPALDMDQSLKEME